MTKKNFLIVVAGPTAVGKTDLCVQLAKHFQCEILSADSRQFYKEMAIGTAKPTPEEMQEVTHHFVNSLSIQEDYNVGKYEKEAIALLDQIFQNTSIAILTGGSGLFIQAVCEGIDNLPQVSEELRQQITTTYENEGLAPLLKELEEKDPVYFEQVDQNNPQRVMRAIEAIRSTGKPFSALRQGKKKARNFTPIKIMLNRDREKLYQRIDQRMDMMLANGLEEEVKSLVNFKEKNALQTVGYKEIFDFMEGKYDHAEMIRLLKRNSRRYAKRQLTWFRRDAEFKWFHPQQQQEIVAFIQEKMS